MWTEVAVWWQSLLWSLHSLILDFSQLSDNQHGKSVQRWELTSKRQALHDLVALSCDTALMCVLLNSQKLCDSSYVFVYKQNTCWVPSKRRCLFQSLQPKQCLWDHACTGGSRLSSKHKVYIQFKLSYWFQCSHTSKQSFLRFGKLSELIDGGGQDSFGIWSVTSSPLSAWVWFEQVSLQKDVAANSELPFQGTWRPLVNGSVKPAHTKESFPSASVPPEPSLLSIRWAWTWQVK